MLQTGQTHHHTPTIRPLLLTITMKRAEVAWRLGEMYQAWPLVLTGSGYDQRGCNKPLALRVRVLAL